MKSFLRAFILRWETLLGVLLIILVIGASLTTPGFASTFNLSNSLSQMAEKSLMMLPLALIIIAGDIDISGESIVGLTGVVAGLVLEHNGPLWLAITAAIVTGTACGAFNGFFVTVLGLPALVVTLGTYALFRGLCYVLVGGTPISTIPTSLINFGNNNVGNTLIPQDFLPFLILAPIFGVVLHRMVIVRRLFAIGANPNAAV